jgi:signal transduction histidine kinase
VTLVLAALVPSLVAVGLAWRVWVLGRRLELVAEADHELRGPLGALGLGLESARRQGAGAWTGPLELEMDRARLALADLGAARRGRRTPPRPSPVDVEPLLAAAGAAAEPGARAAGGGVRLELAPELPPVRADRVRLAQALGNVLANAVEHGGGRVELRGRPAAGWVRLEVVDAGGGFRSSSSGSRASLSGRVRARRSDRGRGLRIAARALEEAGGRLSVEDGTTGARVRLDLPRLDA